VVVARVCHGRRAETELRAGAREGWDGRRAKPRVWTLSNSAGIVVVVCPDGCFPTLRLSLAEHPRGLAETKRDAALGVFRGPVLAVGAAGGEGVSEGCWHAAAAAGERVGAGVRARGGKRRRELCGVERGEGCVGSGDGVCAAIRGVCLCRCGWDAAAWGQQQLDQGHNGDSPATRQRRRRRRQRRRQSTGCWEGEG
jgi:hypothetical protein